MLGEFRKFLFQGNVVGLAVAVVIGAAFGAVISALVTDLITPLIAAIVGQPNFSALVVHLNHATIAYGLFLNALIAFVLVAAAIFFLVVMPVERMARRHAPPPEPATKACPECCSAIPVAAKRCPFCTSPLAG